MSRVRNGEEANTELMVRRPSWFGRQVKLLRSRGATCVLHARPEYGANFVFQAMALSPGVLWIELDVTDGPVAVGNRLSRALQRATGASLFGYGMTYHYGLGYLAGLRDEIGPITVLISNAHFKPSVSRDVFRVARDSDGDIGVISSGFSHSSDWQDVLRVEGVTVLRETDLSVLPEEIEDLVQGVELDDPAQLRSKLVGMDGGVPYEKVLQALSNLTGHGSPSRPSPSGIPSTQQRDLTKAQHLEALIKEERWIEAFELASLSHAKTALHILTEAADAYFARGEASRFLPHVRRVARQNPEHEGALYWLFQAYISLGRLNQIERRVERFLSVHEAPRLAATYASVARPPKALSIASAAVAHKRIPETLASLGFLWAKEGEVARGVSLLREAFEGYRAAHRHHRAIQVATSIGGCYVSLGDYRRATYWAKWGLDEFRRRELREELLRLSCTNLLAYSYLLAGEFEAGQELLAWVKAAGDQEPLPPTMEGLTTTLGDYDIVAGQAELALKHYRRVYQQFFERLPGYATQMMVRGLLHSGRVEEAHACLSMAKEATLALDSTEAVRVSIAETAFKATVGADGPADGDGVLDHVVVQADAVLRAEYVLALATIHDRTRSTKAAQELLDRHRDVLGSLGHTGWVLLAPPNAAVNKFRASIGVEVDTDNRLFVLNDRSIMRNGVQERLSGRFAELIAVLMMNPQGLTGEALLFELYGEKGKIGSLKALISRCRKYAAIEASPYRLEDGVTSDLTDLESHLQAGRLHEALELYRGPLLPESQAPGIERARERIDEMMRQAALHATEGELVLRAARKFPEDLELWERAAELIPKNDPTYPMVRARVRRIVGDWGL